MFEENENTTVKILKRIREPIAEYQSSNGLEITDQYSFTSLVKAFFQHAYNAALTILTMIINLFPMAEGGLYLARFVLDKLIDIAETKDLKERIIKIIIFIGQFMCVLLMMWLFYNLLLSPIFSLVYYFINKIFNLFWGK